MVAVSFGFLLVPFQALDAIGPMDILGSCSKPYIAAYESIGQAPPGFSDKGIDIKFHHIGETLEPVKLQTNLSMVPSIQCDSGLDLDYLLVGGPSPFYKIPPCFAELVKAHVAKGKTLFTTCTGSLVVAQTGILDGKDATVTHGFLPLAREKYPKVNWKGKKTWEISDGHVWSAAGAVGGMDMIWHWVKENYGRQVANFGLDALNFAPRDVHGNFIARSSQYTHDA